MNLCILKGILPFKTHKIIFFPEKKILKKICVPTLPKIFRPVIRNTYFFNWPYINFNQKCSIFLILCKKSFESVSN